MLSTRNSGAKVMLLTDISVISPHINKTFNYFLFNTYSCITYNRQNLLFDQF